MTRTSKRVPATPPPRRTVSRAFRNRMLRQAGLVFIALGAVLFVLVGTLDRKTFLIAALVLIPIAAFTFNFLQRRAYAAYRQVQKR